MEKMGEGISSHFIFIDSDDCYMAQTLTSRRRLKADKKLLDHRSSERKLCNVHC